MNKTVYVVQELDTWGRYANVSAIGVFDSLDAAVTSIMDNAGFSEEELNCVEDMRQYLTEHRCTPNLKWNYLIQEYEMNEWT